MPTSCGGLCNGQMGCGFASSGTSCGQAFCNTRKDLASLVCDGHGTCGISLSDCTDGYACDLTAKPGSCRMTCTANADCLAGYYCNGNNEMCQATKADALTCATDAECTQRTLRDRRLLQHGLRRSQQLQQTGLGRQVPVLEHHELRHRGRLSDLLPGRRRRRLRQQERDDGRRDRHARLRRLPPAGFVADNTDCDDGDASVHPGQTGWFTAASKGLGTFDYDCDGTEVKEFPQYPGASCTFCPMPAPPVAARRPPRPAPARRRVLPGLQFVGDLPAYDSPAHLDGRTEIAEAMTIVSPIRTTTAAAVVTIMADTSRRPRYSAASRRAIRPAGRAAAPAERPSGALAEPPRRSLPKSSPATDRREGVRLSPGSEALTGAYGSR